jgi:hypothetical protein
MISIKFGIDGRIEICHVEVLLWTDSICGRTVHYAVVMSAVFGFAAAVPHCCGRVQQGGTRHTSPERVYGGQRSDHTSDVSRRTAMQWSEGCRSKRDTEHQHHAAPRVQQCYVVSFQASQDMPQRSVTLPC